MLTGDLIDFRVWNDVNSNTRHGSIDTLGVISRLTRETQSRHRNGNLMDTTKIATVISLLVALSNASERLVDIIKGLVSWLNQQRRKPAEEDGGRLLFKSLPFSQE
jgi:hypothetical protein